MFNAQTSVFVTRVIPNRLEAFMKLISLTILIITMFGFDSLVAAADDNDAAPVDAKEDGGALHKSAPEATNHDAFVGAYSMGEDGNRLEFMRITKKDRAFIAHVNDKGRWVHPVNPKKAEGCVLSPISDDSEIAKTLKMKGVVGLSGLDDTFVIIRVPVGTRVERKVAKTGWLLLAFNGPFDLHKSAPRATNYDEFVGTYSMEEDGNRIEFMRITKKDAKFIAHVNDKGRWVHPVNPKKAEGCVLSPIADDSEIAKTLKMKGVVGLSGLDDAVVIIRVSVGARVERKVAKTGWLLLGFNGPFDLHKSAPAKPRAEPVPASTTETPRR